MARRRNAATGRPLLPGSGPVDAGDRALLVTPGSGGAMSRLQRTFNGLVQDVAALEGRMSSQREDLEFLLARYQQRVAGPDRALAEAQFALARALATAHARIALKANAKKDLGATICGLCEDGFLVLAPDAQTESLYEEWAGRGWREAFRQHEDVDEEAGDSGPRGEAAQDDAHREAGADDAAGEPQDESQDDHEDDESPGADAHGRHAGRGNRGGRRTADFVEREARRAKQAELSRRSVRDVYLALARVLHPDAVTDAAEREGREAAMKQATAAYRQSDLLGLLRLELQWIRREEEGRKAPGDDTLRAYIRALREQVARLEDALLAQAGDPRYDAIATVSFLPRTRAVAELERRAKELRAAVAELVEQRAMVLACESRAELAAMVRGARHDRVA